MPLRAPRFGLNRAGMSEKSLIAILLSRQAPICPAPPDPLPIVIMKMNTGTVNPLSWGGGAEVPILPAAYTSQAPQRYRFMTHKRP